MDRRLTLSDGAQVDVAVLIFDGDSHDERISVRFYGFSLRRHNTDEDEVSEGITEGRG